MATTYTDQYLTRIREGATYTPASQTPVAQTFNQRLEPYSMDIGSLYRQLDINATGPFAEKNEYKADLINYIKGTLLQTASEGKVLEYEDKVRDAILISAFTGRDVQTDVLPNFDRYAKQFTGIDTDKNVLKSFQDYFEANSIQKQISNLTMMLTNIPYDDERRPSYEAMLDKARTDYATKTADVSTKSYFWRQVAASGNIVAQSVEQMSRVMSTQIMAFMLTGGLSLGSSAVSGIQNITNAARVGSAMKLAGTASAVQYTATTMMKAEAAEIASTLMDMVDENGNRIPLDIIRDNAYRWGIASALVEMGDDFITPIGNVKLGTKTIGEAFSALKGLLQRNPIGYVGLFAGSTALQTTQEGIQGAIRQKGINDAIRQANEQGFTSFKEDQVQDSASEYWNTAWDEFKESFIPMAATQLLTGGLTFTTAMLSKRMQITPQMNKDAAKYFTAKQGQIFDIGYIDTVGEQPVNIYAPKEGAENQEQAKASPILMTVNKQTGALVPVYRRDRQYAEYLRSNGVTAIRGIIISDDFVSKVGNTASANNLASILGVRIGEQYPVMGYDGDTIIMDTQEGVDAAAADIDSLKADIFGNPEVVNLEKQENGNYRLMWETDSGRERSVTIRAKNDTDQMRTTTGEGETAQTTGNVNPIRRMDTQSMNGLFNSSIRKSKDQTLEDAEVEGAAKYFYSQITGMTLDEVEAAWKDDYQAIMERMPAGVDENTIEQGARFMPLLSAITGRTTEDLLNDPQNKISLVYGGKAQIARYKNGQTGYVEGSMRTLYDKDTGVTTYEIRITDIAKDSGTALVHELMHIARAMASQERLSGFVGLKGYTSKYGGMWRSDIKETKDGRYRLGARLFDTYEEAAALVEGNEERFVQDFFEYLKTGESPNAEVASFFGALKRFLQNFRSAFAKEFTEETKAAFDKLLSGEVTVQPNQTIEEAVEASDATLTDMYELQEAEAADDFAGLATNYVDDADMYDEQGNPQYSLQNNYLWQVMDANTQRRIDADYERTYNEYYGTDKWMKAPNGKPTNLTERQWVQVRTPAFKEWFGDWENDPENASKVVDENGEPMVVYHGSRPIEIADGVYRYNDFSTFDASRTRDIGIHFSVNKGVARMVSWHPDTVEVVDKSGNPTDRDSNIFEVFLNIRTLLPVIDFFSTSTGDIETSIHEMRDSHILPEKSIDRIEAAFDSIVYDRTKNFDYDGKEFYDVVRKELSSLEAPGFVYENYAEDTGDKSYAVLSANQIKSATNNSGAFSTTNDNILFSIAPPVDSQEFHDWFDGSKVVDENGNPMVVYHGSPIKGIDEFMPTGRTNNGEGLIYATNEKTVADIFAKEHVEGSSAFRVRFTGNVGETYPLYMDMKHPLDFRNLTDEEKDLIISLYAEDWYLTKERAKENFDMAYEAGNHQYVKDMARRIVNNLEAYGYDGLIANMLTNWQAEQDGAQYQEYAVPRPEQVRKIAPADLPLYSLAYHGSAADFSEFSLDKINTGEGAQAFGWGLYVTDSAGIGKSYAKADQKRKRTNRYGLTGEALEFEIENFETLLDEYKQVEHAINKAIENNKDAKYIKQELVDNEDILFEDREDYEYKPISEALENGNTRKAAQEIKKLVRETTDYLNELKNTNESAHRNLYKVKIPDELGKSENSRRLAEWRNDLQKWRETLKYRQEERESVEKKSGPYWEGFIGALRDRKLSDEELKKEIHDRKIALNKDIRWAKFMIESAETHWIPTLEEFVKKEADNATGKYLDWDEKIGVEEILRVSNAMVDELGGESAGFLHIEDAMDESDYADWKGEDLYRNLENFYESWKDTVSVDEDPRAADSTAKLASMLLHRLGYTGIRYEAERHSRKPGQKSRYYNYVIFDENDIKILNHWTYDTDAEGAPLFSLSPARQAEVLQARKSEIENAVNAGIFVSTQYLEEFRGEAWADAELEIRDWMTANPDIVSLARSSDSLQEFKDRYLKKNRKQEQVQQDLDFDDIPFDEPEGFEAEFSGAETQPEPESEDTLSDTWFEKIYGYAHAQSLADRDRQFAAEWTSSEDKTLELAKALRGYMDAIFNPRSKSRSGGYWTTKYVYNSFKGVSNKVRMLQDGKKYNQERSSSAEIQEAQKLIRQNPRPYRNAYQLAMMGESRADEARSGQNVGMTADWMRLEAIDDDIAQEMERLESEEERTRRLKTDYKAKYEDIKQKLRDAEKDLAKYQESARSKISDLSDYLTIARRRIDELNSQIKENEADMKSAEREYSKLIERLGGKIENLQEQNAELRGYRQQAKQLEKQLQDRRARVEELRGLLSDAHREERRLNNALNALRRWKEAKEAADYRKKRIAQIQRLANFNPGSVDASFEESLMWISNLFERDEEVMAERKSIDERIADLKAQIDTARSQGENVEQMQQNLLQLRKQKKESRKLLPPAQLAIYLPADYMVRADNRQSAWTAEELDVLLAAVKKMRADAKQMLEQKENARMSRLMGFAYGYFQQAVGRPAARNLEGEMSSYSLGKDIAQSLPEGKDAGILNTFRFWNAKLQRLARRLDGNKEGLLYDWFVRENYRHQSDELEAIRRRLEAGEAKWNELGLKGSDLAKEGYTGTKQNGTEYSLSRGQMLGVYIYSKSELGMEKLTHYNGNDFTEADVKDIISELTPTEIEWADFMLADMQANYSRLAEVYYRGWNMNLGQRENYFTLVPSDAATESQLADGIDPQGDLVGKDNKAYVNKDFTKNVNPNAIYPLDLDVTRTWNWQVRKQEHFIAYGEWAKDSQYLFDSKGGQIYKVMERTADLTQAKYFKKIVDNVIGSQQTQNDFDKSYTRWLARRNSAVLIGNTGTMLKQGPSWFAAFNGDVDVSEALKNAVAINATFRNFLTEHPEIASEFNDVDKAYDFIWANAPEMKDRQIDMDIMEQLNRMDGNKFTYLFNPANRAISKWTMGLVDKLVVNNLWMSRYYTVFNQQKKDGKTDMQAHKEAAFKASQFISETQPTSMRMDQSASQIDAKSSAFLRSIMVFTNQVVNTFNQLYLDVPMAFRQKNAKKVIATLASSIFMISLAAVLSGKFVRRGDEDGKEYAARLARELIATGLSASAPGFGSIVAAGLEYDSDYSTYIFGLDTVGKVVKDILTPNDRKTFLERMGAVLEDIGVEAGYAIGAPVTPVKNIIKGIKNENPAYLLNGAWGQIVESYK